MKTYGLYESSSVKVRVPPSGSSLGPLTCPSQIQTLKTAIEAARVLLRVDDIVQATRKEKGSGGAEQGPPPEEMMEAQ